MVEKLLIALMSITTYELLPMQFHLKGSSLHPNPGKLPSIEAQLSKLISHQ